MEFGGVLGSFGEFWGSFGELKELKGVKDDSLIHQVVLRGKTYVFNSLNSF